VDRTRSREARRSDGDDGAARFVLVAARGPHGDAGGLLDRCHRRAERDLAANVGRDRLVQRRRAGREAPAEYGRLEVRPDPVIGGGDPAQEVEHRRIARRRRRACGDPEQEQLAHTRRRPQRGDPVARRHVEVLKPLSVRRAVRIVAARGGEQCGDRALQLSRSPMSTGSPCFVRSSPKRQCTLVGSASCSRAIP
jgi:hypothetical protein